MKANEVLTEKEAKVVIATLKANGITTRVTRVAKDGFVVKAEQLSDEKIKEVVKETPLPEDKAKSTAPILEKQESIEAEDELKEEKAEKVSEEQIKDSVEPVALPEDKAKPQVAKVKKNYTKASEHLENTLAKQDEEEMKEQLSEDELMDEEEVLKTTASLVKAGITVTVTPMGRKKYALAVADKDLDKAEDVMAGEIYSDELKKEEDACDDMKKEEIQEM